MIGALLGATTPGQSGPWSNDYEGVLRISQSSSITGTSPSDCLVSYTEHSLVGGITPPQSVYSIAPADWVTIQLGSTPKSFEFGSFLFGFFILWHVNFPVLFNAIANLVEKQ